MASAFLNTPIRTNREAAADITAEQQRAEIERNRRLQDHGAGFCREILDGAFERLESDEGKLIGYRDMQGRIFDTGLNPIPVIDEVA